MVLSAEITEWIEELQDPIIIPLEQVESLCSWLQTRRSFSQPGIVIGPSGTGKTLAIFYYLDTSQSHSYSASKSIVLLKSPSGCDIRAFYLSLIETLYRPVFERKSTYQLRSDAWGFLRTYHVNQLIIDDADRLKPSTFPDLRDISDRLNISVILVANQSLEKKIAKDECMKTRFRSSFQMNPLTQDQFVKALFMLAQSIFRCELNMSDKEFLFALRSHCQFSIKILDETLRYIALYHLQNGCTSFSTKLVKETFFSLVRNNCTSI
jgi:DNA transposition AAA+ family ATPase